jgi:purine-binding chemotaxis protein CheW
MSTTALAHPSTTGAAGTYLTFQVGEEEYGVEILRVREIIGMQPITPVPGSPAHVIGVINLRGNIIPVMSMRERFGMGASEAHPHNVIIVIENGAAHIGIAVDRVREVASFVDADIEPRPAYGLDVDANAVKAIGKSQGRIRILLDIHKVLGDR